MRPIFVRKLSAQEKTELRKLLKSTDTRLYKRARAVWLSASQRLRAPEIANIVDLHLNKVRRYIRRFNQRGIAGLYQKFSAGRPREINDKQRKQIIAALKSNPRKFGLAFSNWSLRELCQVVIKERIIKAISPEWMRRIIAEEGYSYKRSKRWITSPDPEYEVKKTASRGRLGAWTSLER